MSTTEDNPIKPPVSSPSVLSSIETSTAKDKKIKLKELIALVTQENAIFAQLRGLEELSNRPAGINDIRLILRMLKMDDNIAKLTVEMIEQAMESVTRYAKSEKDRLILLAMTSTRMAANMVKGWRRDDG